MLTFAPAYSSPVPVQQNYHSPFGAACNDGSIWGLYTHAALFKICMYFTKIVPDCFLLFGKFEGPMKLINGRT